jgi:hypothetical protein
MKLNSSSRVSKAECRAGEMQSTPTFMPRFGDLRADLGAGQDAAVAGFGAL